MSEYVKDLSVILAVDWCARLSILGWAGPALQPPHPARQGLSPRLLRVCRSSLPREGTMEPAHQ